MSSVEFVMKTWTICCWAFCSQTTQILVIFIYLFVKDSWKCTKFWNACAEISFYPLEFLFGHIPFAVSCDCCLLNLSPYHQVELYHSLFLIRVLFHPQLPSPPLLHTLAYCLLAFPQHSNTFTPLLYHPLNFSLSSHFTFHLDIFKRFFLTL